MLFSIEPPFIAHRGASQYAPENTLAAFRKAKELGINWVELDVMLTQDDTAVVIHDELLDRTTNGKGYVGENLYSYLHTLDSGSWFHPQFVGEKIPTLREVLILLKQLKLSVNIEIKPQRGREEITVKKVLNILQEFTGQDSLPFLVSSFSLMTLEFVRKYSINVPLGFLMDEWNVDWEKICDKLHCNSVNVNHDILDFEKIKIIKSTQRLLLAYTVNNFLRAKELFSWGVDAIFTDDPIAVMP